MKSVLGFAFFVLIVSSCDSERRGGGNVDFSAASQDLAGMNVYGDLGGGDSGVCGPGKVAMTCATPLPADVGCGPTELCGTGGTGNGVDDDCNGKVDEVCTCTVGDVQRCFLGPPGKRGIGACTDGMQTCTGSEFGVWGDCKGGISPTPESCDGVDNECNGCADDGLCCDQLLACPTTVPDAQPYTDVTYMGGQYFTGTATTWSWTVKGGPCDQLFSTTTGSPPAQSFSITDGNTANPKIHFTLSGDYTVTMTVTAGAQTFTCTWVQHVAGPGVRFELCWDTTGFGQSDLDLHVHKPNSMTPFFDSAPMMATGDDCNWRNCKASPETGLSSPNWGYAASPLAACAGGPEGFLWTFNGSCRNPRLDIDNIINVGVPENINIDKPLNGDTFRALVHYYSAGFGGTLVSHPLVNVYCGGRLKTTYGQAPDQVQGFTKGGGWSAMAAATGDMWRVADVTAIVDAAGNTTDCTVTALHPSGSTSGYLVGHDNNISYNGN